MNFLTAPVLYALLAAAGIAGIAAGVQTVRLSNERADHAETKRQTAETLARLAELTAKAATAVRARETEVRDLLDASNAFREQGIADAVESQQVLVADLRAGNRRLRQQWAGCPAADAVPGDSGTESGADGGAELRAESAGRIARAGDDADIQVRGLQAYARACQALTRDEE